jgi:pimeloyl-ACP methyl ester carboxylesterase
VTTKSLDQHRTHGASANAPMSVATSRGRATRVVMLPGLHGTCELMQDFARELAPDLEPQAIDYPRDRVLDHAALAKLVRPQLPTGRPFVLLGESFSGPVALELAAHRPHGLRGVVLSTSFAVNPRPGLARFASMARAFPPHAMPLAIFEFWLLGRWATPKLRRDFAQVLDAVDGNVLAERLVACLGVDVRDTLPKIPVPLLYLRGRKDRLVPPAAGKLVVDGVKEGRIVDLDAPHCLLQAIPAQAAQQVKDFVAALPVFRG